MIFFSIRKGIIFKGACIKQHFFNGKGKKEGFSLDPPLKLIMKANPHHHCSGDQRALLQFPAKGTLSKET